ncbi:helix-turn-helix domain-containing protein [Mycobacterium paraffinicum]|uniref:Helix-turn-helix domain-containing protein n=1 Tax=Mycobacterium paraffinicum TaxID=53378 RepID=A0ABP8F1Y9_9MYCO|nr:helix-turn-helix domain-containing protein [Mycobacterium paraffinicum]MCV7311917.1 helix-turn-helix domain-containing protein [Mycobacterium paraffinicum]
MNITLPKLLKADDVAEVLNCNRRTVWRLIAAGQIPAIKVGNEWRIRPDDLADFMSGGGA